MKKIKYLLAALSLAFSVQAFAERAPEYISPNNDGVKDSLVIPLKIKERGYIKEWKLTIYNMDGDVIRTISNKRKTDEKLTFTSFFKKLISPKTNVDVPENIVWNGLLGDEASAIGLVPGEVAPDGKYYYTFSATDDNDNTGVSPKYYVIVDCTAPVISLEALTEDEKSFGEGTKPSVKIKQAGSEEVLWSGAIIYSADGTKIKTYKWENSSPAPEVIWDGTGDNGVMVNDGVYYYEIFATDKAGNTSDKAIINNIIFSAEKPEIGISLKDSKSFSPNGDGIKDEIKFDVKLPVKPSAVNFLKEWKIQIVTASDEKVCYTISGGSEGAEDFSFDGKNSDGIILPDGVYKAVLTAKYQNGYIPPAAFSPEFALDVSVPTSSVTIADTVFNGKKSLKINQKQTSTNPAFEENKKWIGQIKDEKGSIIKTFDFGSTLPGTIEWNGTDEQGNFSGDGKYVYELICQDDAGNTGKTISQPFTLDTTKTELVLTSKVEAFSKEPATFNPTVKAASGIDTYKFVIKDSEGKEIFVINGEGDVPSDISWDGKTSDNLVAPDGKYFAQISTVANSGTTADSQIVAVVKDTVSPLIKISSPYKLFSPDGLSTDVSPRQTLPVKIEKSSMEQIWNVEIKNAENKLVRSITQSGDKGQLIAASDFAWDGKDNNGNKLPNGNYTVTVYSVDLAGNRGEDSILDVVLDKRETGAFVTATDEYISPNGDGFKEEEVLAVRTILNEGILAWSFDIISSEGKSVKNWTGEKDSKIPANFVWDGKDENGKSYEGSFFGKIVVEYQKGNKIESQSTPFVVTATAPILSVVSSANPDEAKYFSPDNDGYEDELDMALYAKTLVGVKSWSLIVKDSHNESKVFWKTSGKSMPSSSENDLYCATINWDGRGNDGDIVMSAEDYPYEFTVTDNMGMTSVYTGIIPVDVLVMWDNGRLKMQVPSIIFRGDSADFLLTGEKDENGKTIAKSSLTKAQRENDIKVLKRVAQILKKFGNYKIIVVGHANPMAYSNEEELRSLSLERAQYVKKWLVSEGKISESRLSAEGKGGSETIANSKDTSVNWKNRRVEFILEKN